MTVFGVAALLACGRAASPSSVVTFDTPRILVPTIAEGPRGAFFALSVRNVDSLSAWYHDKLGFHIIKAGEAPNGIARFAILEADGSIVEMVQHRDARPRREVAPATKGAHEIHGIFKAGLHVADIDRAYRHAQTNGVAIPYALSHAPDISLRSFIIRDAEGNLIQFFGK